MIDKNKIRIECYDKVLDMIDTIIRNHGRSNLIYKTELEKLRNDIIELQKEEEKKDERK